MSLADQQWCPTSVQVTVLQARGLRIKGKSGTNDAYAVMQVGKEKYQTSVVEKSVAPVWKEEAAFDLPHVGGGGGGGTERTTLHVHVLHRALMGPDKQLGQAVINLLQLSEDKTRNKTEWFKLLDKTGKADKDRGEVLLDIQFMRNNMTASMFDLSAAGKSRSRLGKFKDKVRGKKKESDTVSTLAPSFTQVLTDSEDEANGDGEAAACKDGKNKKHKMKSLFSPKSNLQKNMSQSMSVLPVKNSTLSGSQSSGLNVDSSEGKKKFKFKIHKRSGSSESKDSQKQTPVEQSNMCINGSHVYCEEPPPRTSRIGSNFSLASSGHGSMEDVPENSPPSVDSLRTVRQYSPWTEEEEEEEMAEVENTKEEEEERTRMEEERRRKEEEEETVRRQQEELERLAEEKRRHEEEERRRAEEEKAKMEEEKRRREEEERVRREEERERLLEEEKQRKIEEEERQREEEARIRREEEKKRREEEERVRMEEERAQEERRRQEEERKLAEEKRRIEEERRKIEEEKVRKEEEERRRREEERAEEERRQKEEEELLRRREEEQEEKRRQEQERREKEEEEERIKETRRREEEEKANREKEEYERLMEEKRKLEEERKRIEAEERIRKEEEETIKREVERMQKEEEEEKRRLEEQEKQREEEERIRKQEQMKRGEEEERARQKREEQERLQEEKIRQEEQKRVEEEERSRKEEQERIRMEEELRQKEEERRRSEEEERVRKEEEERVRKEEEERIRVEEQKRQEEEEKARREKERLAEERLRLEEQEKKRKEEDERIRREERAAEARRLEKEKLTSHAEEQERENKTRDGQRAAGKKSKVSSHAEVASTNPFDENFSCNPFEEIKSSSTSGAHSTSKEAAVQQRCQSAGSSVGSKTISTDEKDLISSQREKRPAPKPPGRNQAEKPSQREQDVSTQINKQIKDKDVKTVSVLPQRSVQAIAPLSRSPTDSKNTQSLTQSDATKGTNGAAKHGKRPAPSRPRSVEEEPSSGDKKSHRGASDTKQVQVVYGLNPFEDDEDEEGEDTTGSGNSGPPHWPLAVSTDDDKDAASQARIKSSKIARAPRPPSKSDATSDTLTSQDAEGGQATDDTGVSVPDDAANQESDPHPEPLSVVHVQENPLQESQPVKVQNTVEVAVKKEGPPITSRRLQPVRPLNPLEQQSVSVVQEESHNKSTGLLNGTQDKTKVNNGGIKGPYSQLTQQELISLVLKQENQLSERDKKISELEQYIDNLLVRVLEERPSILMSLSAMKKAA